MRAGGGGHGQHRRVYPCRVRSPRLGVKREDLANFLRSYGEDDLAERSLMTTDEELNRIGILGGHYAFS